MTKAIICFRCGKKPVRQYGFCETCLSSMKRSPARVSLQRRVGRSASDGQPEAVARPIGRKKAVRSGNPYYLILSPLVNAALGVALEGTKLAQLTQYKQGGDIVKFASDVIRQARILMESQTDAASRRRQRAITANDTLCRPADSEAGAQKGQSK